ncbi:ATP-binding protein [Kitasatospora sp. NPDC006697]|uniref:ATP-binding protein n=1 Tax=Kitasatospora sp. NPDC006697 TaxID=3364020 RepID=UPI003673E3D2
MLADTPNAVQWARRHAVDVLRRWLVPPDVVEVARLLVSELTTNAVRHPQAGDDLSPYSPSSPVRSVVLRLVSEDDNLFLLVQDGDARPPTLKSVGADAESGRGVFLVDALSAGWGYYHPAGLTGKVVWARLSLASGPSESPRPGDTSPADETVSAPPLLIARTLVGLREL